MSSLKALWTAASRNGSEFLGFAAAPKEEHLLLKLHGSLGWYVIEEGGGDIGSRDELRHNTAYAYFRIPYDWLWISEMRGLVAELAAGGPNDPLTKTNGQSLSRKAGALWIRPYLVFARALKTHPDRLSLDLMTTFTRLLESAEVILVIGYSWGDVHINDLIFDAVGRGARLINISASPRPKRGALALWKHRFPTTSHLLRKRLWIFGGGARRVLEEGTVQLPSGRFQDLDMIAAGLRLPVELSLAEAFFLIETVLIEAVALCVNVGGT